MMKIDSPVYPIAPSFLENEDFDIKTTEKYINYLQGNGANVIMTTAGTSQYNLLTRKEINLLNDIAVSNFNKQKIIGMPAVSTRELLVEIENVNKKKYTNTAIMLLYPERFYYNSEIIEWAFSAADLSKYPVFLHGMFIRKGTGGTYNYTSELYNELIKHPNIWGTKEETNNLSTAFDVVDGIKNTDFSIIVAGGTLRRFMFLNPAGANSFLSGVGSIFPQIEEVFYKAHKNNDIVLCKKIIQEYETPLFNAFKNIGWHPALREALKIKGLCKFDRKPFVQIKKEEKKQIKNIITKLETKYKLDTIFK